MTSPSPLNREFSFFKKIQIIAQDIVFGGSLCMLWAKLISFLLGIFILGENIIFDERLTILAGIYGSIIGIIAGLSFIHTKGSIQEFEQKKQRSIL